MHACSNIFCQGLLQQAAPRILRVLCFHRLYFFLCLQSKNADVVRHIGIARIEPELIKLVRASALGIQPDIATFGFSKLGSVCFFNQWCGQRKCFSTVHAANQLGTRGDISPLIATTHLQHYILVFPQVVEIITLYKLVGKLCKTHPLSVFAANAVLHRILCHHIIDRKTLAHIANKIKESKILKPIVVVYNARGTLAAIEIEKFLQLLALAIQIVLKDIFAQQIALSTFSRRVTHQSGSAANQGNRRMTALLKMQQCHYLHKITHTQRICCWVKSNIACSIAFHEQFFCTRHSIVQHSAPLQLFNKIFRCVHAAKIRRIAAF